MLMKCWISPRYSAISHATTSHVYGSIMRGVLIYPHTYYSTACVPRLCPDTNETSLKQPRWTRGPLCPFSTQTSVRVTELELSSASQHVPPPRARAAHVRWCQWGRGARAGAVENFSERVRWNNHHALVGWSFIMIQQAKWKQI